MFGMSKLPKKHLLTKVKREDGTNERGMYRYRGFLILHYDHRRGEEGEWRATDARRLLGPPASFQATDRAGILVQIDQYLNPPTGESNDHRDTEPSSLL